MKNSLSKIALASIICISGATQSNLTYAATPGTGWQIMAPAALIGAISGAAYGARVAYAGKTGIETIAKLTFTAGKPLAIAAGIGGICLLIDKIDKANQATPKQKNNTLPTRLIRSLNYWNEIPMIISMAIGLPGTAGFLAGSVGMGATILAAKYLLAHS